MKLKLKLKFEKLIECQSFNLIVALIHNSNAKEGYRLRMFQNQLILALSLEKVPKNELCRKINGTGCTQNLLRGLGTLS